MQENLKKNIIKKVKIMKSHTFWSYLLLISCIMCIVTGHQSIKH